MMDSPACFALMLEVGNKADCTCCAIRFGGSSNSGEPLASEGEGVWRCLAVEKLNHVELHTEAWHTGLRSKTQTCMD